MREQIEIVPLVSRRKAAEILGLTSPKSIERRERAGLLQAIRLNQRVVRYRLADVLRLVKQGEV